MVVWNFKTKQQHKTHYSLFIFTFFFFFASLDREEDDSSKVEIQVESRRKVPLEVKMTDTLIFCKLCIIIVGILFASFVFWSCGC